jgi:hypothetical protein
MHDKNHNGFIDSDECLSILYAKYSKVRMRGAPRDASAAAAARRPRARWSDCSRLSRRANSAECARAGGGGPKVPVSF